MFKEWNVLKKISAILMSLIVCSILAISGYATEILENSAVDEIRGIETLNDTSEYVEDSSENEIMSMSAMPTESTPIDATPIGTVLKDKYGYITSGKWECKNGIIVELVDNVLTISGNGKMGQDVNNIIAQTICKSSKYKVKCVINNGITEISTGAYINCYGLNSIEIPNSVTSIWSNAFSGCSSLGSIEIPESVTRIGNYVFNGCSSLESIEIPEKVTSIGFNVFSGCSSLRSIEIPNSVTNIEDYAFSSCSGLSSIEIPEKVTSIGFNVFSGCSSLSSIKVTEGNTVYDSRENCNAIIETETNRLIVGCYNTKISESVTSIGSNAFSGCSSLGSIEIPESVTRIGNYVFNGCSSLESIEIPEKVTSIGFNVFSGCSSLRSIEIPNSVTNIEDYAFSSCSGLSSIEIPEKVTSIGFNVFSGCSSLSSIKVTEGNTVYDSRENCNAIIETGTNELIIGCYNTKIPESVTSIGRYAFSGCSNLSNIEIPERITSIGYWTFENCSSLTKITNNSSNSLALSSIHNDGDGQWYLENTDNIVSSISNGQTAVYKKTIQYGDINSDGSINIQDGVLLKKHLAGIKGIDINLNASDVNADGSVNIQDAVILMKHLAGMNVTMGK